jgi:DNA-binding NarL/FixJ family response regulator
MAAGRFVEVDRLPYTPREWQCMALYARGWTRDAICSVLGIGHDTYNTHWKNIMEKTPDASCRMDLLRIIGWLNVPDIKVDAA